MEELYRALYSKYAGDLSQEEVDTKIGYALQQDPNDFVNAFYQKYTGSGPSQDQLEYINSISPEIELPQQEQKEEDTAIERVLGKNVVTDFFGDLYRAGEQGLAQGATVDEAFDVYKKGKNISDEELNRYIEVSDALDKTGASDEMREYEKIKNEAGGGVWGFMKGMIETRGQVIPQVIVSSAAAMGRTFFDSEEAAAMAGTGAASGAALGSVATPIGTATGAIGGAVAGLTGSMETALTLTELLKEELGDKDFNKENIRAILEDEELFEDIKDRALARGATIGAVEGITVGLSRGVGAKLLAKGASKGKIARQVTGIEMTGGAGGEALGQVAAGQEFDIAEVLMEGVAEAKGVVNVADILAKKEYKINGEKRTRKEVLDKINNTKAESLADIQFEVTGDRNLDNLVKQKQAEAVFETQIDERVDEADRKKLVELEKKRAKAEADKKKTGIFAVPGAETTLENIEGEIADIIGRYEAVDRRTSDVRARKKIAKEVRANIAERDFQTNLEFAKKHSALYGLEVDDTLTLEQIKKQYGDNAALSDGFVDPETNKIIINKTVAKFTKAVNVGNHELLHGILRKALKEGKINRNLIKDLEVKLGKNNWSKVQQRIIDGDYGNMTVKAEGDVAKMLNVEEGTEVDYLQANPDEYLTLLSDAIAANEIEFNEGLFSPIKELLLPVFRAFGFNKINFDSADGVYDFLKEYNRSIHKGTLSSAIVKATEGKVDIEGKGKVFAKSNIQGILEEYGGKEATKPDLRRMVNETLTKTPQGQETFDITKSRFGLEVEPIVEAITKRLYDKIPSDATRAAGLTRADYKNALVSEAATMTQQEYDATIQDLDTFISNRLNLRAESLAKRLGVEEKILKDVDFIKETEIDVVEQPAPKPKPIKKEKTREIQSLSNVYGVANEVTLNNKIQALIEKNPKNLEAEIRNLIEKDIRKAITKQMGKISKKKGEVVISDEWKSFLALNYENIVKGFDVATIKKNYNQLFELTEIGKEDKKTKKADKPSLKKDSNYRKGVFKIETNKAKFTKFFTEGGYTTLLDRQKKLAILIGESITEDIINDQITENSNSLDAVVETKMREFANSLNRQKKEVQGNYNDQLKFSRNSMKDANMLKNLVMEKRLENVYDNNGKLLPAIRETLLEKRSNKAADFIYSIAKQGYIQDLSDLQYISRLYQKIYKAGKRGAAFEASIIDTIKELETEFGQDTVYAVLRKPTEADALPDVVMRIHNTLLNIEAKMSNAQYSSVTFAVDENGNFNIKKDYSFNDQILGLGKKVQKGIKAAKARLKKEGYEWNNIKVIPTELYEILKSEPVVIDGVEYSSYVNAMSATMDIPLDVVSEIYNKKKHPVNYMHMMGRGLFYMGGFNNQTNVLGTPELKGNAQITLRIGSNSQYKTVNKVRSKTGNKILSWRAIPTIPTKTLETLKPHDKTLDNAKGIKNIINSKEGKALKYSVSAKNKQTFGNAVKMSRSVNKESKGITVLDFDDTLATTKSLVKFTRPDGTTGTLNAEEYANTYEDLLDQGFTFDFSDFNKVVKGKVAPLFQKALKLQGKFGPENMFVLTARPPQAAKAIFDFLKANGLNIPMKNITGLANSTAEAKALWIADKVGEGYNDFYFADDALQNVQAVKNMLEQFDVKSKVQQAKVKFSKSMNDDFNSILEEVTGIDAVKRFSDVKARKRGADKGKFRFFIPPSHEDFVGLLYNFMGKGRKGDQHRNFFEQALVRPLNRAYREIDTAKQAIANDYKSLNKQFSEVKKKLIKTTPDGDFTFQDAIRVYLWNKHGYKIPGLSPADQAQLSELVANDAELSAYAEALNIISKQEAYVDPGPNWETGNIRIDLVDATGRVGRASYFAEFNENAEVIFSAENLNKIEAAYGKDFRSALEDMLHRIKTGVNRPKGSSAKPNAFMNWLNASVSGVMFFNTRSALLQQMSNVNFLNFADNNIFAAGKAFANQIQYWKDFAMIFNSDMLKQRRGGLGTDINGAELAEAIKKARPGNIFDQVAIITGKALKLGFLPTQIGDNIAIATGGAAFYRNRVNKLMKDGMSKKEAEAAAFTDLQNITQSTQQSARPDMTSAQQASWVGKIILNFLNTPSQYNRIIKKAGSDIKNRRITPPNTTQTQSDMSNMSRILYYGAAQNLIFYGLQTALFAVMFGLEDDDEEKRAEQVLKKKERVINGAIDTILRGSGIYGVAVSTVKNMAIKFLEQRKKDYNFDESAVLMELANFSPVVGIKLRKIVKAEKSLNYNKKIMKEMETFDIDNPQWSAVTNYVELTGFPANRLYQKTINLRNAADNQYTAFQRAMFFSGYTTWSLNLGDTQKMQDIKESVKSKKKKKSKGRGTLKVY